MTAPAGLINNRIAVLCDVNTATTDTDDSALLFIATDNNSITSTNVLFYNSPDENADPFTNVAGNIGEYWLSKCGFRVKEKCIIQNININIQVQVLDAGGNETVFSLDAWNNPTDSFYNGLFTDISIIQSKDFYLDNNSVFNKSSIVRDNSIDGGGYYGYELKYGFQLGYEWWQNLNEYAKQFETYRNQYWAVYTQNKVVNGNSIQTDGGSASIKFILTWDILDTTTGISTEFNRTCNVTVNDADYTNAITGAITTQDAVYGDDLNQQIANDVQTTVVVTFTGIGIGTAPAGKSVIGWLAIYYENGSVNRFDRNMYGVDLLDDSIWINQPSVTVVDANTITVEATVDPSLSAGNNTGNRIAWPRGIIYGAFGYAHSGLHTDADIQIQTDSGIDIVID